PLDVGVFKALKEQFKDLSDKRLRRTRKKTLNRYDFCAILRPAWLASVTPKNIVGGFEGSGIWPINREKIRKEMLTSDDHAVNDRDVEDAQPGPSGMQNGAASTQGKTCSFPVIAAIKQMFEPLVQNDLNNGKRRITKTRCLTSNEFLEELQVKEQAKRQKRAKQACNSSDESSAEDDPENDDSDEYCEKRILAWLQEQLDDDRESDNLFSDSDSDYNPNEEISDDDHLSITSEHSDTIEEDETEDASLIPQHEAYYTAKN
ncbi:hypothetical protein C0J52_19514, partial [Blattella germanica]